MLNMERQKNMREEVVMKRLFSILVVVGFVLILGACGGGEDEATTENTQASDSSEKIVLEATNWDFDQDEYHANAGEVTIELVNVEGVHGITIDEVDFELEGEGSQTIELEAGEYTVRCSIPCGQGHDEMVATIHVS